MTLCALLLCSFLAVAPCQEPASLPKLLDQLPQGQSLLPADPLEVARFHAKDESGKAKIVPAEGQPGSKAFRVEVFRKTPNHWDIGMNWACPRAIEQDDVLMLAFRARNANADPKAGGEITLGCRRLQKPYHHALSEKRQIWGGWRQYVFPFSPDVPMEAEQSLLILNFGTKAQTIEIADVRLINFGHKVSLRRLYKVIGAKPSSGSGKTVGHPLSPESLWDMGAYSELPVPDPAFTPDGNWVNTYTI